MELRSKVLSALSWAAGAKFAAQIFRWAVTLVVVRLLSPGDYGLMALATLVITLMNLLAELGLGASIVQKKVLTDKLLRQIFGVILILNTSFLILVNLSAPYIASFFNELQLAPVIQLMSVSFIISAFGIVPEALLEKELIFKNKSIVELIAATAGGVITLLLAILDFGVWSLVWGKIVTVSIKVTGLNIIHPYIKLPSFSFSGLGKTIAFSATVTSERLLWFFYTQADNFILGKIFGKDILGIYSVSIHLASMPMQKLSGVINQVAFPAFSSIQSEREQLKHYIIKSTRLMSFFTFPVFWGMSSVAPELIHVILGSKWQDAALPLQLLTLVMPLRMIANILSPFLRGIGFAKIALGNLAIATLIMPAAFYIGTRWSLIGVCIAWLIAFPFVFTIMVSRTMKVLHIPNIQYYKAIIRPAIAAALMYASVILVKVGIESFVNRGALLGIAIAVGIASYLLFANIVAHNVTKEIRSMLKRN